MEWFKFYHNKWLTDPKIIELSAVDRACFITLLCLASQSDDRNGIVTLRNEALLIALSHLKSDEFEHACGVTDRLRDLGLIDQIDDYTVQIRNFEKRQETALTNAERQKRYRIRKKNEDEENSNENSNGVLNDSNAREDKIREDKSRKDTTSKKVKFTPEDMQMVDLLIELITANNPEWTPPKNKDKWAEDINKIHRLDKRDYRAIESMIRWTQQDDFWKSNILSAAKLRKQFNNLIPKARAWWINQQNSKREAAKPKSY